MHNMMWQEVEASFSSLVLYTAEKKRGTRTVTGRQADRRTDRQTDAKTDRQTDRQCFYLSIEGCLEH